MQKGRVKNIKHYYFLLTFWCLLASLSYDQQPSFYKIGHDELAGVNIYSIIQDLDANIWLTTENGLMRYDGYQFHNYHIEDAKLRSLFGLTLDNEGTVYCHSVNGQIYHVENDTLQLYYELPDSCKWNYMHMTFDDRNHLIISCKYYYDLSPDKKLKRFMTWKYPRNFSLNPSDDGRILLADLSNDKMVILKNGELSDFATIPKTFINDFNDIQTDTDGQHFVGFSISTSGIFRINENAVSKIELKGLLREGVRIMPHIDKYSNIWVAYETNGVQVFDSSGRALFGDNLLFPKCRVSDFYQDREGNFWLTTFGRGIFIIPSLKVLDIGKTEGLHELSLKSICKDGKDNIFIGSGEGSLFKIEDNTNPWAKPRLLHQYSQVLSGITYLKSLDVIYSGADLIDPETGLKKQDFLISEMRPVRFSDFGWLFPLNTGVLFEPDKKSTATKEILKRFNFRKLNDQGVIRLGRCYMVHWDPVLEHIWVSTTTGMKIISTDGILEKKYNGNTIYGSDFLHTDKHLWVATRNSGILVFKGDKLVRQITEEEGLLSNNIIHLREERGWIYFSTSKGIQRYHHQTGTFQVLNQANGLNANNIIDFEVTKNHIWVITPGGLQRISKTVFNSREVVPVLIWDDVFANDSLPVRGQDPHLAFNENKLYFEFHANAFHHRGTLEYQYKLSGVQESWQPLEFAQHSAVFSALSPGTYTFMARAKNESGVFSNEISQTFTIDPPYWETWWFYLICTLVVILIFILLFRLRLRIVKKRLIIERELKVSEIKAIKAQMNPHFVFNALNSLQDLVMQEDIRATNIYLTRFAELMRGTLELSGQQFIPLEKELEMLELYLQLEKLRFGDEFRYTIDLNLKKTPSEYLIPAMLLQPYVENAVKHGLLHKENDKQLSISFNDTNEGFKCEITDNGIGRKRSAEINKRKPLKHESFSQAANESRIDLINQTLHHKIEYQIIDLVEDGKGIGTTVRFFFNSRNT